MASRRVGGKEDGRRGRPSRRSQITGWRACVTERNEGFACHTGSMWVFLVAIGLSAPPEFTHVRVQHDCNLFRGPVESDGVATMLAECHWRDVEPATLIALLEDYENYDELIFAIESSVSWGKEPEGEGTLVLQRQSARGIAPREVLVRMTTEVLDEGIRVAWETADHPDFVLSDDAVRTKRNEGSWLVTTHPEGGSQIAHRVAYHPGGMVPSWLVRWASVGGLMQAMGDIRERAAGR